jgi:hypothetical protein
MFSDRRSERQSNPLFGHQAGEAVPRQHPEEGGGQFDLPLKNNTVTLLYDTIGIADLELTR